MQTITVGDRAMGKTIQHIVWLENGVAHEPQKHASELTQECWTRLQKEWCIFILDDGTWVWGSDLEIRYFAIWDGKDYLETGLNSTSRGELKTAFLSLIEPEVTDHTTWKKYKAMGLEELLAARGFTLDHSDRKFQPHRG